MEIESRILEAAFDLQTFCEGRGWRCCLIGGLAVQRWGQVRATQDADLTLLTGFGEEEKFIDPLLEEFIPRRDEAREFALKYRVLTVRTKTGVPLDIAMGALPFEEHSIQRSSIWDLSSRYHLRTCSAEDLIIHKVFAGRDIDWVDVRGILVTQGNKLNFKLIQKELTPLLELKVDTEALPRFEKLRQEVEN
ncbi:MAG: hypothetical protein ACFCUX_08190 [Candidatus Methylacidiphilales bacterium]